MAANLRWTTLFVSSRVVEHAVPGAYVIAMREGGGI